MTKPFGYAHWRVRRLFMFVVSGFCMAVIAFCVVTGQDSRLAETAVSMAYTTLIAIVGSYVFGATWEDVKRGGPLKDDNR